MTRLPGKPFPEAWDLIPDAHAGRPETCGFRNHFQELVKLGLPYSGSARRQQRTYQREITDRLRLQFEILSDSEFERSDALRLPTFEMQGTRLLKRLTLTFNDEAD